VSRLLLWSKYRESNPEIIAYEAIAFSIWLYFNLTKDVLDKWARILLRHMIPHTFVGFPWWVLTIYVRCRIRRSNLHFMLTALGYQPRTTSASFLLIRLVHTRATTVRYGVSGSSPLAWTLYVDLPAYDPLQDRRQSSLLGLPFRATVVKLPFTGLPQLIAPSG
jgi:hypothetical protein